MGRSSNGMTGAQANVSEPTREGKTRCEKLFERGAAVDAEVHGFIDFLTAIGAMRGDRSKEVGDFASATRTELVGRLEGRAALGTGAHRGGLGHGSELGRILDNRLTCRLRLLLSHSLFGSSGFSCSSGLRLGAGGLLGSAGSLLGSASLLGLILSASRLNRRILLINSRINSIYLGKLIGKTGSELGFACHGVKRLAQLGIAEPNVSRKRAISSCAACTCAFSSSSVITTPANLIRAKGIATIELALLYTAPHALVV